MSILLNFYLINKRYFGHLYVVSRNKSKTLKFIAKLLKSGREIKIELGAGDKRPDGWITLDNFEKSDIHWDLKNGIPFPDGSVTAIYSSHFLEHFTYKDGQKILVECKRVLKPNGIMLVCVPNSKLYIEAYVKNDDSILKAGAVYMPAWNDTTKMDYLNYVAYMDGHHKYMFDEENLLKVLEKAGFKNAQLRNFNPDLDLQIRDFESIYAEANA